MIPDCTLVTACYDLTRYNNNCRNKNITNSNIYYKKQKQKQ